jgi:type II secretory pathway pseudopilin PulG
MCPRRLTLNVAFIPSVECRAPGVDEPLAVFRHSTPDTRHSRDTRAGMTMIELGVVMGIVTVLLALVLGLSRHVNEVVKIRRAQTELGEWHETLNAWYLKYGQYPDPTAPQFNNAYVESNLVWLASTDTHKQYRVLNADGTANAQIPPFSSLMSRRLATHDPWGTPYFYRSTTNAYELLSCGPNTLHAYDTPTGGTELFPFGSSLNVSSPNADDLYFEP